jgi:proteasome lid subunit RPN8/RPN11
MARVETLVLPDAVRERLQARARHGAPAEVCGVLAGRREETDDGDVAHVDRAIATPNGAADPRTTYEIPPEHLHRVLDRVEAAGDDVLGFYHSHPRGPCEPSDTDRRQATWTGYAYLVVVPDGALGAWRATDDDLVPVAVRAP